MYVYERRKISISVFGKSAKMEDYSSDDSESDDDYSEDEDIEDEEDTEALSRYFHKTYSDYEQIQFLDSNDTSDKEERHIYIYVCIY